MNEIPKLTPLQRAQRAADFVRTIPMKWVDSELYEKSALSSVLGFVEARYRVNTPDRVFIVQTMAPQVSLEMLERAGIKDMSSCFLIAVRSLLGADFPKTIRPDYADEILELNRQFTAASEQIGIQIEAVYTNGKCERTGRDLRFEDWIDEPKQAAEPNAATQKAQRRKKPRMPKRKVEEHWQTVMDSGNRDLIEEYLTLGEIALAEKIGTSRGTLRAVEAFQKRDVALREFNRRNR